MQNNAINPLKDQLLQLADPRLQRGRKHELIDVLMIAVTALLCGAEDFTHMAQFGKAKESWLRTFLTLSNGIPSPRSAACSCCSHRRSFPPCF